MKKGVVLFIVLFLIMISGLLAAVCGIAFQNLAAFTKKYEISTNSRYLCECGIARGIWLLDGGYEPGVGDTQGSAIVDEIMSIDSETAHLVVNWNADGTFEILSTSGTKTISVMYSSKKLLSWEYKL